MSSIHHRVAAYWTSLRARYRMTYDVVMSLMAIYVVISLIVDVECEPTEAVQAVIAVCDNVVWLVFTVDYVARLVNADDRFRFVRRNIVDLVAILPFDVLFQGVRAVRVARLLLMLRAFAYLNRAYTRVNAVLRANDFDHVLWFTFCTIMVGATSISIIDGMDFGDAVWWSFVTTTTVGYGDIAPTTLGGRLVATCLMIVGIGFISTLTGSIATFFINGSPGHRDYASAEVETVVKALGNFDELTVDDLDRMHATLRRIKTGGAS